MCLLRGTDWVFIYSSVYRKVMTYKKYTGGREVTKGIIPHPSGRNMTNASAVNAEATPYSQVRNSKENVTENRTGKLRGTEWGTIRCARPRDTEVGQVLFGHLLILILELKW